MKSKPTFRELVKKSKKKKELVWAGAQALMGKPEATRDKDLTEVTKERNLVLLSAKVLNISPFGVNILGSVPYINKLGLNQKKEQYNSSYKIIYNWIKYAEDDNAKAICAAKMVDGKGKDVCDWVIGECSPSSMKMGTLKGYQNHMAQTRAKNRCILEVYGVRIHEDMMENIKKLSMSQETTPEMQKQLNSVATGSTSSVEEMNFETESNSRTQEKQIMEITSLKAYCHKLGCKLGKEKEFIEKLLKRSVDIDNLTGREAIMIKTQLMAQGTK